MVQAQAMTAQANWVIAPRPHQQVTTMASRLSDFTRMNPPAFYGSKVDEDPQEFNYEVSKILLSMVQSTNEKAEFATYQLEEVAQVWFVQWKVNRPLRGGPLTWEIFKKAFLDQFFSLDMKEVKVVEFINLLQGGINIL